MARRTTASTPPPDEAPDASEAAGTAAASSAESAAAEAPVAANSRPTGSPASGATDASASTSGATDASASAPGATDAAAEPPAPEPDAAPASGAPTSASAPSETGFFTWLRGLGVLRQNGWLGGVCAGIATRIGIDPLLVRGIAVVLAVVGAPVVLIYAVAWFLLPDAHGTIHAKELGHGRVTRALPGIVAVFLLSFLPLTQGFWYAGALYWGDLGWGGAAGRIIWTAVLLAGLVVLVVWLARRSSSEIPVTPATTDDRPETVPQFPAEAAEAAPTAVAFTAAAAAASATTASAPLAEPGEPPAPPTDASAEELANWKASQEEWQKQRAAWAAEQRRSERDRRQAEAQAQAVEAARLARERTRIRKLTRPRASAGIVFLVLGVALVSGAIAAFTAAQTPDTRGAEWMIGAAVLVLVLGLGTVAVALGRRRSGALAFFSMLAVAALAVAIIVPADRRVIPLGYYTIASDTSGRYAQLAGSPRFHVADRDAATTPTVDLLQYAGDVAVFLEPGATFQLVFTTPSPSTWVSLYESIGTSGRTSNYHVIDGHLTLLVGTGRPDLVLRFSGLTSTVYIEATHEAGDEPVLLAPEPDEIHAWDEDGKTVEPDAGLGVTPTPSPTDTDTAEGETP
jgi:phage shock protein PspC (stress-responsive transcriptional regulator)